MIFGEMDILTPLLAVDFGDLLKGLIPIIFLILWVLSQVMGDKDPGKPPKRVRRQGRPGGQPPAKPELRSEIEAFLKEAARKKGKPEPVAARGGRAEPVLEAEVVDVPGRRNLAAELDRKKELARRKARAQGKKAQQAPGVRHERSVTDHVERHMDTSDIDEHASQLGEEVGLADEKLEARLQAKFDHSVGSLAKISDQDDRESAAREKASTDLDLANLLGSPDDVRKAIILNEVLRRPLDRW